MYIYQITHLPTGYYYIGRSKDPDRRFRQHLNQSSNRHIRNLVNKHGKEGFVLSKIDSSLTLEELKNLEQKYLEIHFDNPKCVNHFKDSRGMLIPTKKWEQAIQKGAEDWRKNNPEKVKSNAIKNSGSKEAQKWREKNPELHRQLTSRGAKKYYKEKVNEKELRERKERLRKYNEKRMKPVSVYIKETGQFVRNFESIKECIRKMPELNRAAVRKCINGEAKSYKGYIFKLTNTNEK